MNTHLYYSNHLEALADFFAESIYSLEEKILVVPSNETKEWLFRYLAKKGEVVMGFSVLSLSEVITSLWNKAKDQPLPGKMEIYLALFSQLDNLDKEEKTSLYAPLFSYLEENPSSLKRKNELAKIVSDLFFAYGMYQIPDEKNWQGALWKELFSKRGWGFPLEMENFSQQVEEKPLHFFGFSFLPPIYFTFLQKVVASSQKYYFLSPCQMFWEDVVSDFEKKQLLRYWEKRGVSVKEKKQLEGYLHHHPLLANWGMLGKERVKLMEEYDFFTQEKYVEEFPPSLLGELQKDLLSMEMKQEDLGKEWGKEEKKGKEKTFSLDLSLQVHGVFGSKRRELEIVLDQLLSREEVDVMIVAEDISVYLPFIHQVFGPSPFTYKINQISLDQVSHFSKGVIEWLSLLESSWEPREIISFLDNPCVQKRRSIEPLEVEKLSQYIEKAKIHWGRDSIHRKKIMGTDSFSKEGTWEKGLERILWGLVYPPESDNPLDPPFFPMEWGAHDLFSRFLAIYQDLQKDVICFSQEHPLSTWADLLEQMQERYFLLEEGQLEETKALQTFLSFVRKLRKHSFSFQEERFSLATISSLLKKEMKTPQGAFQPSAQRCLHFASLREVSHLPAQGVWILGMDEESFPKRENPSSLNLLSQHKGFIPTKPIEDRYHFLELILSARKFLAISYFSTSSQDGKKQSPSLLVSQLCSYVEKRYGVNLYIFHPYCSFDESYFDEEKPFLSLFSKEKYQAALPQKPLGKSSSFWTRKEEPMAENWEISTKDLLLLGKSPLQFFLNKSLGIYLERENKEDRLELSYREKALFRKQLLKQPKEKVISFYQKQLPSGVFGKIALDFLEKEGEKIEKNLQELEVTREEIFTIERRKSCAVPREISKGFWEYPPLEINIGEKKVVVTGKLEGVSKKGVLSFASSDLIGLLQTYPQLLLSEQKTALFLQKPQKKEFVEISSKTIESYFTYVWRCREKPSPLLREWAFSFFLGEEEKLEEKILSSYQGRTFFEDPYVSAVITKTAPPKAKELLEEWKDLVMSAFAPLTKEGEDESF